MLKQFVIGIAATLLAGASVFGQGTVNFANSSTTTISYGPNSFGLTGLLPTGSTFMAQLYYAPGTDPAQPPASLETLGASTAFSASLQGRFSGGFRTTPTTTGPGARAWFQVKVWESAFGATYEDAAAAAARDVAGTTRQAFVGTSQVFNIATGAPPGPATAITTAGGMTGFQVVPVPEPSTFALGLLGLAGLFLLRRRNS